MFCVLFVATLLAVPSSASAATAHADAGDPAHINPDCDACHKPHQAPTERSLLSGVTESEVCYVCHGDPLSGSNWNVETGTNSFTGMASGHVLEDATDPDVTVDLTDSCTGCHGVHGDPDLRSNLPANEQVAGATIDPADPRSWCLACHNVDHAWYSGSETAGVFSIDAGLKTGYEALIQDPTRNASYYPTLGTFPGSTSNATYLASTHATGIDSGTVESLVSVVTETVTRVQGDCLWCHASHRSTATYDGLLGEYRASTAADAAGGATPGEYAQACFECHGNSSGAVYLPAATFTDSYWATTVGAPDIYALVTDTGNNRSGHRIQTAGAYYAVGSPLPCYECHNPHGSKNGNALMISDALGSSLDPAASAVENRYFCFACHTTLDGSTWYGSDGTAMVSVSAGTTAVGLDRTTAANKLTLSATAPHSRTNTTQGCTSFGCHGSVHNPNGGVSTGGVACYDCHGAYETAMEYNGSNVGLSYHHVLGNATNTGDRTFTSTTYPSTVSGANTDVYCLSCHVDHDLFYNGAAVDKKGYNLRSQLVTSPTAANSDYNDTNGGICLGCHSTALTKSTLQKTSATESATTPAITLAQYSNKAHDYDVASAFSGATNNTYNANCVKCHNDEEAQKTIGVDYAGYQTSTYRFGTHYSAENRIAKALGASLATSGTSTEENLCFKCHDAASAANDGYGVIAMRSAARAVEDYFTLATYANTSSPWAVKRHAVVTYSNKHKSDETQAEISVLANKHVECEDCHDPHAAGKTLHTVSGSNGNIIGTDSPLRGASGIDVGTWPTWASPASGTYAADATADYEYEVCFKCHSAANTNFASWGGTGADLWTNVALEFNTANRSYHPVVGSIGAAKALSAAWMDAGWTAVGTQTMTCSDCHGAMASTATAAGPHGSSIPHVLKGYWPIYPGADGTLGTADDAAYTVTALTAGTQTGILCDQCHTGFANQAAHTVRLQHRDAACYSCHLVVPHGGNLQRLIGDSNGAMPARYAYAGNKANLYILAYTRNSDGDGTAVEAADCTTKTGGGCSPASHNGTESSLNNW